MEKRECQVNELVVDGSCPRYSETIDWTYVIQCGCTESKRNEYLSRLREKLGKTGKTNSDQMNTNAIISDIKKISTMNQITKKVSNWKVQGMVSAE